MSTLEFIVAISWPVSILLSAWVVMLGVDGCVRILVQGWKDVEILKSEGAIEVLEEEERISNGEVDENPNP